MKEELFDDLILERGYEYAQEGAVDHVRKVGEVIYATVHGTEDYHVKIDDKIFQKNCKNIKNVLKFEYKKEISRIKMKNKERE